MKSHVLVAFMTISLLSCKSDSKKGNSTTNESISSETITTSIYPEHITKVFDAHGGIDVWKTMKSLSFTMDRPNGIEVTTTNLKNRNELIDAPTYRAGFNGDNYWVISKGDNTYKGNIKFYKGLMMYFYAMPFIVGDSGIIYEPAESLTFEGTTYPGIKIAYEPGVGVSSDDEYIIYYDENTKQMAWLGYTVTYGKDGKSDDFHFIHYNNWQTVNGLLVPKSMDWYNYENGLPTTKRNTVEFKDVTLTANAPDVSLFAIPEGATLIE